MNGQDQLKQFAIGVGFSRRQFMVRATALGISATVANSIYSRSVAAQSPQKGGHLVIGCDGSATTDSLDPATTSAFYMQVVTHQWGNCLTEVDESGALIPELAESWDSTEDARTWVFKIRKGVQFHNGKELTAADAVYSLRYHHEALSR